MARIPALFLALLVAFPIGAQEPVYGCSSSEAKQFDFWVGEWDLTYAEGKSRNRITKILEGCGILEEFSGGPGTKLEGHSVSTFDRATKRWKQTWIDNTASYLDFAGGMEGGRMILSREATKDGNKFLQRMVWQDIKPESLKWLWQRSDDAGANWKTLWEIEYRRVK